MSAPRRRFAGPIRLGPWRRWSVYLLTGTLFVSGVAWWWLRGSDEVGPSPYQPWWMRLHGGAAMLALYLVGTLLFEHMVNAWQRHRNRISGSVVASVWALMVVTGYGLYYFGGEGLRRYTEWVHWGVGLALPAVLALHVAMGRRSVASAKE